MKRNAAESLGKKIYRIQSYKSNNLHRKTSKDSYPSKFVLISFESNRHFLFNMGIWLGYRNGPVQTSFIVCQGFPTCCNIS